MTQQPIALFFFVNSKGEVLREVVFERELDPKVVGVKAVLEVRSPAPYELTSNHRIIDRGEEQVGRCVVTSMESAGGLCIRVLKAYQRVSECAAESLAPEVIECLKDRAPVSKRLRSAAADPDEFVRLAATSGASFARCAFTIRIWKPLCSC